MANPAPEGSTITVNGSCHCGTIKYTATLPTTASGSIAGYRCNCTFCNKLGQTHISIPPSSFTLLSPASASELGDYTRVETAHKYFCQRCGVHVWACGSYVYEGTTFEFFNVNLATVDQPQEGVDLSEVKLGYYDGLRDNQKAGTRETPFPGGLP